MKEKTLILSSRPQGGVSKDRRWLTTRTVEALSAGERTVFRDRALAGFAVVVEPSGRKTYVLERGAAGAVALGRHGSVSAEAARRRAADLLAGDARPAPSVAEAAILYLREYVECCCKPATVAQYRRAIDRHIVPALGALPLAAVGRAHAAELQHRLADRPAAANQAVAVLGRLIDHAAERGLAAPRANPCRGLPRYRAGRRERFLTDAELRRLGGALARLEKDGAIAPHAAAAIRLLALTGCRRNEILRLRWDDVRLETMELCLRDSKTGPKTVPLSPEAAEILARLPRVPGNPWVVPGRRTGAPVSGIFLPWRRARRLAGLDDVRLHDLRHSFASRALALGESLPTIARLLGHARVETTSRYAHLARDTIREAAARVARTIGDDLLPGGAGFAKLPPGAGRDRAAPDPAAMRACAKRIAERIGADILPR